MSRLSIFMVISSCMLACFFQANEVKAQELSCNDRECVESAVRKVRIKSENALIRATLSYALDESVNLVCPFHVTAREQCEIERYEEKIHAINLAARDDRSDGSSICSPGNPANTALRKQICEEIRAQGDEQAMFLATACFGAAAFGCRALTGPGSACIKATHSTPTKNIDQILRNGFKGSSTDYGCYAYSGICRPPTGMRAFASGTANSNLYGPQGVLVFSDDAARHFSRVRPTSCLNIARWINGELRGPGSFKVNTVLCDQIEDGLRRVTISSITPDPESLSQKCMNAIYRDYPAEILAGGMCSGSAIYFTCNPPEDTRPQTDTEKPALQSPF